jgi:hypothetical protein
MKQPSYALTLAACVPLLLLAGCPQNGSSGGSQSSTKPDIGAPAPSTPQYPIPPEDRPYQDINQSAKEAWLLIENGYWMIREKYSQAELLLKSDKESERKRGSEMRQATAAEIDSTIFTVNPKIEQLFIEATQAEPDNPLNIATYAYYLKPRKREIEKDKFVDAEPEALALMDQAIELWPDESSFYLLKVFIMTQANKCHDWLRSQMAENVAIADQLPEIRDLLAKAEQYFPDNHFINYYHAQLVARFTSDEDYPSVHDEILQQIRAGNRKREGFFFYPPPLPPYPRQIKNVKLIGNETEAKYIDQWNFFGHYDPASVSTIINHAADTLNWPQDKQEVGDLMYFLYQMGRTRPFDRTMFSLQLKLLDAMQKKQESGSPERLKLAEAIRYLNEQYRSTAQELFNKGLFTDPTLIDVRGINQLETTGSHAAVLRETIQGPQANFLKRAGEILGLDFPLPDDPSLW